ncbi:MAG: hypothetical protein ACRCT5_01800, partial [Tannerellaceae bacterium]
RKTIQRTLIAIILGIVAASGLCYLFLPFWKATFFACCGAVIVLNILFSLFLISQNFKNKK